MSKQNSRFIRLNVTDLKMSSFGNPVWNVFILMAIVLELDVQHLVHGQIQLQYNIITLKT